MIKLVFDPSFVWCESLRAHFSGGKISEYKQTLPVPLKLWLTDSCILVLYVAWLCTNLWSIGPSLLFPMKGLLGWQLVRPSELTL